MNALHANMMRHPNAVEAAMREAPNGTQLVGQYALHKMQDARERGSKESGLPESELVILGGHFAFNKRDGIRRHNDGWRVYARLQKPTTPLRGGTNKDEPILPPETQKYLQEEAEKDEKRRKELNGGYCPKHGQHMPCMLCGALNGIERETKPPVPPPPPPAPTTSAPEPKPERRTLTLIETMKLVDWLRDNYEVISKEGTTKVQAAAKASKALGMDISDATINRVAKELNLDWKVKVVRKDHTSYTSKKVILNTIRYLFEKLGEKLPQEFTDHFGE